MYSLLRRGHQIRRSTPVTLRVTHRCHGVAPDTHNHWSATTDTTYPETMSEATNMMNTAEQLAENRMTHVRRLIDAATEADEAQKQAEETRKQYASVWNDVAGKSWTEQELKKIGLKEPGTKRKRATRNSQTTTTTKKQQAKSSAENTTTGEDSTEHSQAPTETETA